MSCSCVGVIIPGIEDSSIFLDCVKVVTEPNFGKEEAEKEMM